MALTTGAQPECANGGVLLMTDIFDKDGNNLGDIELSEKQQRILNTDQAEVVMISRTPQMLRGIIAPQNGSFVLRRLNARVEVDRPNVLQDYVRMRRAIVGSAGGIDGRQGIASVRRMAAGCSAAR